MLDYPYYWNWNRQPYQGSQMDGRKGQLCRVIARFAKNSCLLEFVDGFRVVTSRNGLRKSK